MAGMLPVLVHALEPERHPAAARFQVSDFELGKFFQHAVGAEIQAGEHLLQGMAGDMAAELAVAIRAGLRQHGAGAFVHADGDAEVGGGRIDRIVVGARYACGRRAC